MTRPKRGPRRLIVIALVAMSVPILFAVATFAARSAGDGAQAASSRWLEPASGGTCILPRARMRYEHMQHLKSLRDEVVRAGLRDRITGSAAQGIGTCRGCHAHREQFCDRCHDRAGVAPDCFGCHGY